MALFDIFRKKSEKDRFEKKRQAKDASKIVGAKKDLKKKEEPKEPEEPKEQKDILETKPLKESSIVPISLVSPHVTEKATLLNEKGIYVFKISTRSNKIMIKQAVQELYGVRPKKIRIINSPSKKKFFRGHQGEKAGYKKAMVYLKKGDKIEL